MKPVKIEFFKDPQEIQVVKQLTRVVTAPREGEMQLCTDMTLKTPPGEYHLAIRTRVSYSSTTGVGSIDKAYSLIDLTIAKLASVYRDEMFRNLVYRGPIVDGSSAAQMHLAIAPSMIEINASDTRHSLESIDRHLNENTESAQRLHLASKLMARSLLLDGCEEIFLLQWTILEIYPMKDSTHIRPLKEWVANRTGRTVEEIESKLEIGRIYGDRCALVHNGRFVDGPRRHRITDIVSQLCREVIIDLCGRPYAGNLDRLLT